MRQIRRQYFPILILSLLFYSCNRVKDKGKQVISSAKETSKELIDKVHPHFDAYQADTKFNKKRFADFIKVPLSSDIKNIYCFDDAIGIDADYQIAFTCSEETANKIIEIHKMKRDTIHSTYSSGLQSEFDWWKIEEIKKLPLFTWGNEEETYFKYFWYEKRSKKAYFFDFDM